MRLSLQQERPELRPPCQLDERGDRTRSQRGELVERLSFRLVRVLGGGLRVGFGVQVRQGDGLERHDAESALQSVAHGGWNGDGGQRPTLADIERQHSEWRRGQHGGKRWQLFHRNQSKADCRELEGRQPRDVHRCAAKPFGVLRVLLRARGALAGLAHAPPLLFDGRFHRPDPVFQHAVLFGKVTNVSRRQRTGRIRKRHLESLGDAAESDARDRGTRQARLGSLEARHRLRRFGRVQCQ